MTSRIEKTRHCDPCQEMQVDISAMLDGELDSGIARRVLVHLEICMRCKSFLNSLRFELSLGRQAKRETGLAETGVAETGLAGTGDLEDPYTNTKDPFAGDLFAAAERWSVEEAHDVDALRVNNTSFLQKMLQEGRGRLAEIFFQLGRAYIMLAVTPDLVSIFVREPVHIPEYRLRGRAILAGVHDVRKRPELCSKKDGESLDGVEALLGGRLDSVAGNLEKGRCLLEYSLQLRRSYPSAQIFLACYYLQKTRYSEARKLYQIVLRQTLKTGGPLDPLTAVPLRCYAMEHLGVLCIEEGRPGMSLRYFREVVNAGAPEIHPSFSSSLLNLAWANLLLKRYSSSLHWLEEVYRRFPDKRQDFGKLICLKPKFQQMFQDRLELRERMVKSCPQWFGAGRVSYRHGDEVSLQIVFAAQEADSPQSAASSAFLKKPVTKRPDLAIRESCQASQSEEGIRWS